MAKRSNKRRLVAIGDQYAKPVKATGRHRTRKRGRKAKRHG